MGVTWKTANRWYHANQIPGAWQTETGSIFVPDDIFDDDKNQRKLLFMHEYLPMIRNRT